MTETGTYIVRMDRLSHKRFGDAVKLVKSINGLWDEMIYDPQHPDANAVGYVRNDCDEAASAEFDGNLKVWIVTIPRNAQTAADRLDTLARGYSANVERA